MTQRQRCKSDPAWCRETIRKKRDEQLRREKGVTHAEYEQMLLKQAGRCAICGDEMDGKHEPAMDHDHNTGRARELLCGSCNTALHYVERPGWLVAALDYLMRHGASDPANRPRIRDTARQGAA